MRKPDIPGIVKHEPVGIDLAMRLPRPHTMLSWTTSPAIRGHAMDSTIAVPPAQDPTPATYLGVLPTRVLGA